MRDRTKHRHDEAKDPKDRPSREELEREEGEELPDREAMSLIGPPARIFPTA